MDRPRTIKALVVAGSVFLLAWVGIAIWEVSQSENNTWLVEKVANPFASPMPGVSGDDWVAILTTADFLSRTPEERTIIADKHFNEISELAENQGYDPASLKSWYTDTAINAERYPIKKFNSFGNRQDSYRDLTSSGFPDRQASRLFWKDLTRGETLLAALAATPFFLAIATFIVGIFYALFSGVLAYRWKALVLVLLLISVSLVWLLKKSADHPVDLGMFHFYDGDDYISIDGTWSSDTKLAGELQVTKIDCWKEWNHCIDATAQVLSHSLSVDTSYWEVSSWQRDEIRLMDRIASLCKIETLSINRKSKIVTFTSAPKQPFPDSCKGITEEPIVAHLVDGYKLALPK